MAFTSLFVFFPISTYQGDKALLHHSFCAVSVITAFNLLQVLFGCRFQLPLTLYSCLLFSLGILSKLHHCLCFFCSLLSEPLYPYPFLGKRIPTFLARIDLFPSSAKAFHGAPSAPRPVSTANLSVLFLLLPSENRCNISGISWSYMLHLLR